MRRTESIVRTLGFFREQGRLSADECHIILGLFEPGFEFADAVTLADSIHVHMRVDDTDALPRREFERHGGAFDHGQPGYVKYCFPDGLNMIFSTIPVAQDNLAETEDNRRPRPYVDHLGIDLRQDTDSVRRRFDLVPEQADALNWGHIPQGGVSRPVYCCHVEVAAKHWVYPPDGPTARGIPLEFAFGLLKSSGDRAGCDLRPSAPVVFHRS